MPGIKIFFYRFKRLIQQPKKFAETKIYPLLINNFLVPVVLNERSENVIYTDFAFANFHILTRNTFYKIAGFRSTLEQEFENWKKLRALVPLKKFIPEAGRNKSFGFSILSTKKLEPLKDEKEIEEAADSILTAFRSLGEKKIISKKDLHNIKKGIDLVEINFGAELANRYTLRLEGILSKPLFSGPVYGDFHEGNILKDAEGTPQLIDWDCYEPKGIQAIDALYFILVTDCKKNNWSWCRQIAEYDRYHWKTICFPAIFTKFVDIAPADISLLLFLSILGTDSRYYKLNETKLKEIKALVKSMHD